MRARTGSSVTRVVGESLEEEGTCGSVPAALGLVAKVLRELKLWVSCSF